MIIDPALEAKMFARFAQPPWTERSEFWRQLDEQLPHDQSAMVLATLRGVHSEEIIDDKISRL